MEGQAPQPKGNPASPVQGPRALGFALRFLKRLLAPLFGSYRQARLFSSFGFSFLSGLIFGLPTLKLRQRCLQ